MSRRFRNRWPPVEACVLAVVLTGALAMTLFIVTSAATMLPMG